VSGQWTGVVGTFAVDGYGAYKAVSGGIKAVKAVKLAMSEGEDFVGAVKRLLSGDLPTTTSADPAPTTPKSGDAPSTPKAGTGKGGKEPGGSGKSGAKSGDEPSPGSESKQGNTYRSKPDKKPNEYPQGPVVSLGRLKQTLARTGYRSEWDKYEVVHVERIVDHRTGDLAEGNSPHGLNQAPYYRPVPNRAANGKPIIEMSNKGLRNMKEAVVTFFHETYHQKRMAGFGDTGTEEDAEDFGQMMWRRISGGG